MPDMPEIPKDFPEQCQEISHATDDFVRALSPLIFDGMPTLSLEIDTQIGRFCLKITSGFPITIEVSHTHEF